MKPEEMDGPLTYIAGPYSAGIIHCNVIRAIDVHHALMDAGVPSICPHLSHFSDTQRPRPYLDWMALDLRLVAACDVVLRMWGVSPGADQEVEHARTLGIPTVHVPRLIDLTCLGGVVRRTVQMRHWHYTGAQVAAMNNQQPKEKTS